MLVDDEFIENETFIVEGSCVEEGDFSVLCSEIDGAEVGIGRRLKVFTLVAF